MQLQQARFLQCCTCDDQLAHADKSILYCENLGVASLLVCCAVLAEVPQRASEGPIADYSLVNEASCLNRLLHSINAQNTLTEQKCHHG